MNEKKKIGTLEFNAWNYVWHVHTACWHATLYLKKGCLITWNMIKANIADNIAMSAKKCPLVHPVWWYFCSILTFLSVAKATKRAMHLKDTHTHKKKRSYATSTGEQTNDLAYSIISLIVEIYMIVGKKNLSTPNLQVCFLVGGFSWLCAYFLFTEPIKIKKKKKKCACINILTRLLNWIDGIRIIHMKISYERVKHNKKQMHRHRYCTRNAIDKPQWMISVCFKKKQNCFLHWFLIWIASNTFTTSNNQQQQQQ